MRRLLLLLAFAISLLAIDRYDITEGDISYRYSHGQCIHILPEDIDRFLYTLQYGAAIIDQQHTNSLGATFIISYVSLATGNEYQIITMNSLDECIYYKTHIRNSHDTN